MPSNEESRVDSIPNTPTTPEPVPHPTPRPVPLPLPVEEETEDEEQASSGEEEFKIPADTESENDNLSETTIEKPQYPNFPVCDGVCLSKRMVECTECGSWTHYACAGVENSRVIREDEEWRCVLCADRNSQYTQFATEVRTASSPEG